MAVQTAPVRDLRARARDLVDAAGRTFADEIGIDLHADSPEPLFRLLCFTLLCSTRIGTPVAVRAARALADAGWTSVDAMLRSSWQQRVEVLDAAGYVRYDFRTATRLEQLCTLLRDRYRADVRVLREAAGRDPAVERALLQQFQGIGPVGADVFLREAQVVWPELHPYLGKRAATAAEAHGLPTDPGRLARLVPAADFPRLVAALVRSSFRHRKQDG